LVEFYEGQLDRRDAERIRGHLAQCPGCREEITAIEKVILGLRSQGVPDPGEAFWRDFPRRVRKAFYGGEGAVGFPILSRVWERIYGGAKWLALARPVHSAVSIAALVLIVAGLLFFKGGRFWTGSRGVGEETAEEYFGEMVVSVSPFARESFENLSLQELDDVSRELVGWIPEMGNSLEEIFKENGFLQEEAVFARLEGLNSWELDFVYDALKVGYFKSSTSRSVPPNRGRGKILL
jgi:hypothetical protein